jgi:hypothetical protein
MSLVDTVDWQGNPFKAGRWQPGHGGVEDAPGRSEEPDGAQQQRRATTLSRARRRPWAAAETP